uniref:Recep_L_domain domain-containing protein n=1 Tax=Heterorhabditis bacteriophora TaxID=37862 RepID=A0A1I7W8J3_HETBA
MCNIILIIKLIGLRYASYSTGLCNISKNYYVFQLVKILSDLSWNVVECPQNKNGRTVVLQGSDVLFTGKEIFVGIRKNGTNLEGAMLTGMYIIFLVANYVWVLYLITNIL